MKKQNILLKSCTIVEEIREEILGGHQGKDHPKSELYWRRSDWEVWGQPYSSTGRLSE